MNKMKGAGARQKEGAHRKCDRTIQRQRVKLNKGTWMVASLINFGVLFPAVILLCVGCDIGSNNIVLPTNHVALALGDCSFSIQEIQNLNFAKFYVHGFDVGCCCCCYFRAWGVKLRLIKIQS